MDPALNLGPALSIGAVARMANLSIDTIRAWERRYRAIAPRRIGNGRRVFGVEDLERLVLLRKLVAAGASISSIAQRPTSELRGILRRPAPHDESDDTEVRGLIESLRARNLWQLREDLLYAALVRGAAEFGDDIVSALLAELERDGAASHTGELLLTSALVSVSSTLFAKFRATNTPTVLSLSLPGYSRAIPPLLSALVASEAGFNGIFAGTQIDPEDLEALVRELHVVSLIVCMQNDIPEQLHALAKVREKLPGIRFILAASAEWLIPSDFTIVRSLSELPAALHYPL